MPLIWRYLLRQYFQVFLLCVSGFVAVLVATRFQEIARFASSGTPTGSIFLFALYQIPFILPYAIPVSCLIASLLLFQKMSHSQELTALRSCGFGLKDLIFPIFFAGLLLTLCNATITYEIGPRCRMLSKRLTYDSTTENPLFLFQKDSLVRLHNTFVDIGNFSSGKSAEDLLLAFKNNANDRLGILMAKKIGLKNGILHGDQVSLISSIDSGNGPESFDHLVIENQATVDTKANHLFPFFLSSEWSTSAEFLTLRMGLARAAIEKQLGPHIGLNPAAKLHLIRRLSISLAAATFTLLGIAAGIEISRNRKKRGLYWAIALAALYMVSFLTAKSLFWFPTVAIAIFFIPHALIIVFSLSSFKKISRGVE